MRPAGLTAANYARYQRALKSSTMTRTDFHVLTLDHRFVASITPLALDGQIDMDAGAETVWTLNATFVDPDRTLALDGSAPTDGMGGLNRLIQVWESTWVPDLDVDGQTGGWVKVPAFTGQPLVPSRDGSTITVRAYDISKRHLNAPPPYTIARGTRIVKAIRLVLARNGQPADKFDFPDDDYLKARLAKPLHVGGKADALRPLRVAVREARKHGMDLFPGRDGAMVMRLRPRSGSIMTLSEVGEDATLLTSPTATPAAGESRDPINRVVLTNKRSVGKKKQRRRITLHAVASLEDAHAQSSRTLMSSGIRWWNTSWVEENNATSQRAVNARARELLTSKVTQTIDLEATCVPFPHGDPFDLVTIEAASYTGTVALRKMSRPLFDGYSADGGSGDPQGMTIGYLTRVRDPKVGQVRRHA